MTAGQATEWYCVDNTPDFLRMSAQSSLLMCNVKKLCHEIVAAKIFDLEARKNANNAWRTAYVIPSTEGVSGIECSNNIGVHLGRYVNKILSAHRRVQHSAFVLLLIFISSTVVQLTQQEVKDKNKNMKVDDTKNLCGMRNAYRFCGVSWGQLECLGHTMICGRQPTGRPAFCPS